jgi:hypothetical protein
VLRCPFIFVLWMLVCAIAAGPCAGAKLDEGARLTPRFAYIDLPPISVTASSEQAVIMITLEVPGDKKAMAEGMRERLTLAFTQELQDKLTGDANMMQGRTVNITAVKARLMKTAEKIAPGLVHDITLDIFQGRI